MAKGLSVGNAIGENGTDIVETGGSHRDFAGLVAKLARVMGSVGSVEKNGFNEYHNYEYATESDVVKEVREHLAQEGVFLFSTVKDWETAECRTRSGTQHLARVELLFTFADGETGATCTVRYVGEGMDSGDKAFYKAYTGALKYVVMKNFLMATGDDPEKESPVRADGDEVSAPARSESIPENNGDPLEIIRRIYRHSPDLVQEIAYKKLKEHDREEDISLLTELGVDDLKAIKDDVMSRLREQVTNDD